MLKRCARWGSWVGGCCFFVQGHRTARVLLVVKKNSHDSATQRSGLRNWEESETTEWEKEEGKAT